MSLKLLEPVQDILALVAKVSGKPVKFVEDEKLPTYAGIRMARQDMPAHILVHKQAHGDLISHLVARECGHALRLFAAPLDKRNVPRITQETKRKAIMQVSDEITALSKTLDEDKLVQFVNMWFTGNFKQVTSFPADLMIERWIHREYPALRKQQMESLERQRDEGLSGLKPEVARITPPSFLLQSNVMNYAFFRVLGMEFGANWVKPYGSSSFLAKGKQLAEMTAAAPDIGLVGDIAMADEWAAFLGMVGWYNWVPFEDVKD